ncbi:MAG: hypothetical protein ACRDS9_05760 [Pseudonocardiaceae bacterium]
MASFLEVGRGDSRLCGRGRRSGFFLVRVLGEGEDSRRMCAVVVISSTQVRHERRVGTPSADMPQHNIATEVARHGTSARWDTVSLDDTDSADGVPPLRGAADTLER